MQRGWGRLWDRVGREDGEVREAKRGEARRHDTEEPLTLVASGVYLAHSFTYLLLHSPIHLLSCLLA